MSPYILNFLSLILVGAGGSLYLYLVQRLIIGSSALKYPKNSTRIFVIGYLIAVVWAACFLLFQQWIIMLAQTPSRRWDAVTYYQYASCVHMTGIPLWIFVTVRILKRRKQSLGSAPEVRSGYQIQMQDLLIASLSLGVRVTFVKWQIGGGMPLDDSIVMGVWLMFGQVAAFFVVIDVCRYDNSLKQNDRQRAIFVGLMLLAGALVLGPFSNLVSWLAWREDTRYMRAFETPSA